jgi:tetratricopeptide (TPR) repeat protein
MPTILDVFISSKMVELKAERDALFALIPTLDYGDIKLHAWVFEEDAGAVGKPIRQVYLDALQNSALYLGLFWQLYGEYTIDEFDRATEWGMERHIYVKDVEADKRDPNLTAFLNKQGVVTTGITAKWFTGKDETEQIANLCADVKQSLDAWVEKYRSGPRGESSARIYSTANAIIERPKRLIGRNDVLETVRSLLNSGEQVLLQGFSGVGKTALAAEIAAQLTPLIWLRAGRNNENELFEALARPFNAQEAIAKESGIGKVYLMRSILAQSGLKLVVLDDAWNGQALQVVIQAVPPNVALLVTSRRRYGIEHVVKVGDLDSEHSLKLLGYYANHDYANDVDAVGLCKRLGYLAFALRLAGLNLKVNQWNPAKLTAQLNDPSEDLIVPLDFVQIGRETVAQLIRVSLNALDDEPQTVFFAFGAFFSSQTTTQMLVRYFVEVSELTDEELAGIRRDNPNISSDMSDYELRQRILITSLASANIESPLIQNALDILYIHGLVERIPSHNESIIVYRIHELAYTYAKAQNNDFHHRRAMQICLSYTISHIKPSVINFAAISTELDNLMGAAAWAIEIGEYAMVEQFAWNLYSESKFFDFAGYYAEATLLLQQAIIASESSGNKHNWITHAGNLGNAYRNLGQARKAISYYEKVLIISHEIGDRRSEGNAIFNLGIANRDLGEVRNSIKFYEQALAIRLELGDRIDEGATLNSLGLAYSNLGKIEKAIGYYDEALTISREVGDRRGEGNALNNLGIAYRSEGQFEKSISYIEQALHIHREIGDRRGEGNDLNNLGNTYGDLHQFEESIKYLEQALTVSREIGDRHGEGSRLGNLGVVFGELGHTQQAIDYCLQALSISREIADRMNNANVLASLAIIYEEHLQDYPTALEYYQQARMMFTEMGTQDRLVMCNNRIMQVEKKMIELK